MDAVEYKNGQKNNWRRTLWNAIARRGTRSTCIYLPGSRDLDATEAYRRGWKPWDLIAVDSNKRVVEKLRKEGRIAIHASLLDVLLCWPGSTGSEVGTVIADLQCGFTDEAGNILRAWWLNAAFAKGVLAINVMRGRETGQSYSILRPQIRTLTQLLGLDEASRSALVRAATASILCVSWLTCRGYPPNFPYNQLTEEEYESLLRFVHSAAGMETLAPYRSSPVSPLFDTTVITCTGVKHRFVDSHRFAKEDVRRKIAAAKALQTMQREGTVNRKARA